MRPFLAYIILCAVVAKTVVMDDMYSDETSKDDDDNEDGEYQNDNYDEDRCPLERISHCFSRRQHILTCFKFKIRFNYVSQAHRNIETSTVIHSTAELETSRNENITGSCSISPHFMNSKFDRCYIFEMPDKIKPDSWKDKAKFCDCICFFNSSFLSTKNLLNEYRISSTAPRSANDEPVVWNDQFEVTPLSPSKQIKIIMHAKNPKQLKGCIFELFQIFKPDEFVSCDKGGPIKRQDVMKVPFVNEKCEHYFENVSPGNYCTRMYSVPREIYRPVYSFVSVEVPVISEFTMHREGDSSLVMYILLSVLLALIVVGILGYLTYRKKFWKGNSTQNHVHYITVSKLPKLSQKKLFLVHEDCDDLRQLIECLQRLLEKYFNCEVQYHDDNANIEILVNLDAYVAGKLQESDKIILINTEGVYAVNQAHKNNKATGSVLLNILNRLLHHRGSTDYKNVIKIRFPFTHTKFLVEDIVTDKHYIIPDSFEDFVHHVHDMPPATRYWSEQIWSAVREDNSYKRLLQLTDSRCQSQNACDGSTSSSLLSQMTKNGESHDRKDTKKRRCTLIGCRCLRGSNVHDESALGASTESLQSLSSRISPTSSDVEFNSRSLIFGKQSTVKLKPIAV